MNISSITKKLDNLYEFDREPVTQNKLQGIGNFLGMYAGEHVAGTEFVIGILFVARGWASNLISVISGRLPMRRYGPVSLRKDSQSFLSRTSFSLPGWPMQPCTWGCRTCQYSVMPGNGIMASHRP